MESLRSTSDQEKSIMNSNQIRTLELTALGVAVFALGRAVRRKIADYRLDGKTVLVTGGSRGLGLVLAREFASEGARVVICARDEAELERAQQDLQSRGAEVMTIKCDVTNRSEVLQMMSTIYDRYQNLDVLVNNAGVIQVGPLEHMTLEDFEETMKVHFWAPLYTTLAALPRMRERKEGRIVNISSFGGEVAVPHLVPYCASKFALAGLSQGMAAELRRDGVFVTTVCPGLMRTGSPRNAEFKGQHRAEYTWFSLSDALPLASVSAERAARQIVTAAKRGQGKLTISLPAQLAVILNALFPEATVDLLAVANRLLPNAGGIGTLKVKGKESETALSSSWLTGLNERAAIANNEV
jgi:short-subunit dehydrogenase